MLNRDSEWSRFKEEANARLLRDKEIGYLDPDIWDLLEAFMKRDKAFTYSSCSGRITVIDSFYPWSRKDSSVIYKNHLGLPGDELPRIVERKHVRRLWLIVQGPILHVYTRDYEEAWTILKTAREVGFKHSGVLVENRKGILLELRTGIRMVHLLKDRVSPRLEELEEVTKVANEILAKGKEKKNQLRDAILSIGNDPVKLGKDPEGESQLHNGV
ncbi:tRNA(Phe) 7-((3-amino-3-carboxypropyl)-4-demethylwyosine(37)-N(4))-methyltransferase [Metallosphaera sp. J1]|uniref:tRNA(Phe) 7-((3-amino-3-carboxypropyl)-4-demethylwyosine(37)-N(4))- methyltransferase n=1 Tax=Metallosphaera TaxID=41980 RepID=UPI001EDE4571|nr:hypothetical protein [Metallosphaera javensis (ex Hofmann et al. 2022)]MCG3108646.1 tRNA(Phe) 7-((3-amino-3-carboxypropyl)-4-demethylwyosine(37)-N(4))-methyltransferase [Metallosphaera javensis (ex Hofmann et al. 2022)]BCS91665.1 MAG: tRNA(Phe) 7-((3-amino-3-carboxypropyl)-4-demethylwyosine(37)-N(4))-methyltransferase [Metallosphaera javensis (ex Sakai et al. 2022)]